MVSRLGPRAASGILHIMLKTLIAIGAACLVSFAAPAQTLGPDFTELSASVLPTTVHIHVERGPVVAAGIQQLSRDYALPVPKPSTGAVQTSTGSGVIIDEDGVILTNHHVINGAQRIVVTMVDKRRYEATVIGHDPRTDIALLSIEGGGPFAAARFSDSVTVAVGE